MRSRTSFPHKRAMAHCVAVLCLFIISSLWLDCSAQENTQTRIPNSLAECYENPDIVNRDNRLPLTMNTLIELIRKVEDSPGFMQDIRQLATSLVHRFRLDGIEKAPGIYQSRAVLPFSPSAFQFSKHRLLLSRLVPGNAVQFPNDTLTSLERCTLHFMMSSSIDTQIRGDEATRCGQLAQFRAMRVPAKGLDEGHRRRRSVHTRTNYVGDIDMMEGLQEYRHRRRMAKHNGRYQAIGVDGSEEADEDDGEHPVSETPIHEGEEPDYHDIPGVRSAGEAGFIDVASTALSQCPVENGVVRTQWGAVAVGPLITGIAAGLVQQSVTTRELLALTRNHEDGLHRARQQQTPLNVDNRWASTLSGDLAEVALLQGPLTNEISVGASGAWNSTQEPRWYFLSQRERLEMTDAEIRGGIDGLVLGTNVLEWKNQASNLKLSQLLDMYYSQRGVFSTDIRSCNRRDLFARVAPIAQLQAQTISFSTVLDREMQLRVTLTPAAIQQFSNSAAQALTNYVANNLNDVTCAATGAEINENATLRAAADLRIFVDFSWQFQEIHPVVATLLENLDVNRFGSTITLYNANDASVIVNTTSTLSEFYAQWNLTGHQFQSPGLNLPTVLRQLRTDTQAQMDYERATSSVGGRSLIALIIPQMAGASDADSNFAVEQVIILREQVPDLTLLFLAAGSQTRFQRFVRDPQRDLFPLQAIGTGADAGQQLFVFIQPVIQRIQQVPRRVINHRCGSNWEQTDWGTNTLDQYVEPSGINFYRLHPNYFFLAGSNRRVKVIGQGYSQISVCTSRFVERPRFINTTQSNGDVNCRQLTDRDPFEVDLTNACDGQYLIQNCPPVFISVEGRPLAAGAGNYRCIDAGCRFPDSIRFGIQAENLGCYSGAKAIISSVLVVVLSVISIIRI